MDTATQIIAENQGWLAGFAARPDLLEQGGRMAQLRQHAIDRLSMLAFPSRRDEDWRYSDLSRWLREDYSVALQQNQSIDRKAFEIADFDAYVLVCLDGQWLPELSDTIPGLEVLSIDEAISREPYAFWLDRTLVDLYAEGSSAFVVQNAAFAKNGLLLSLGKNEKLDKPVHVIHLASRSAERRLVCSQLMIILASGAELTVDETFETIGEGAPIWRNHVVRGGLASNAKLKFRSIQNEALTDLHLSHASFDQQGASVLDHIRLDFGGAQVRNNLDIHHKAAGLETFMSGAYFARGTQRIDNQTFLDHAYPHGESNELYKGIVMERGQTAFNGKVIVRPDAQKTNAFQQNDNLVIGERAVANTKPQLEIFADDVKCSHGATIGKMNEEPLVYLMARGIPRGQALAMLQRGFLLEVLDRVDSLALRSYIESLLQLKFES